MKIAESAIQQKSTQYSYVKHTVEEKLHFWKTGSSQSSVANTNQQNTNEIESLDKVNISSLNLKGRRVSAVASELTHEAPSIVDLNLQILKEMIERITGKKIHLIDPAKFNGSSAVSYSDNSGNTDKHAATDEPVSEAGFGLEYEYYESHHESETMTFAAEGTVVTDDGMEVDINLELNVSREFFSEQSFSIKAGEALKDPLVFNFAGSSTELTQRDFIFDIDADGREDQISFVGAQSGFLALDKNNDGQINDGSELFGALTGNGFSELAQYDGDDNGWIDENDSIYDKLRVWSRLDGVENLIGLGKKGIGAIYLGQVESPFQVKDENNNLLGAVRSTGLYLDKNGKAGTIQQVDLVV